MMDVLVFILFLIFSIAGLLTLMFGLPGNFIILAAAFLLSWYGDFQTISLRMLIILTALSLTGELLEFVLGVVGAKKYRSSNRAVVASIIFGIAGAVVGAPFLLGIGSVIGAFIGAFAGAFLVEFLAGRGLETSLKVGWGTLIGRVGGTVSKAIIGIVMISLVVMSYFNY